MKVHQQEPPGDGKSIVRFKRRTMRKRSRVLVPVVVCLLSLVVTAAVPRQHAAAVGTTVSPLSEEILVQARTASDPCLENDPYSLETLSEVLSRDDPPSSPVVINEALTVEFIGRGDLVEEMPEAPIERISEDGLTPNPDEPPPDQVDLRQVQYRVFNTRTKFEFELTMDAGMLSEIHTCRQDAGLTLATIAVNDPAFVETPSKVFLPLISVEGDAPDQQSVPNTPIAPAAWSNGIDSRVLLGATTAWPWRTISQFRYGSGQDSGCTGTLVGPRHLVTAAHCINSQGTNTWFNFWVTPGKDGAGSGSGFEPFGRSFIQINPPPGTEAWYFTHPQWRNPTTSNARQWDWGMIVIPDRLGDQTGWMGYVARPASQLNPISHYNRGYPNCLNTRNDNPPACDAPANLAHLHGDTQTCDMGGYYFQGSDGWNRLITHSCDTSAGHSGSPVYHYFFDQQLNQTVPVVAMVHVASQCQTCTAPDTHPSIARRHTPTELNVISFFREVFP